MSPRDVQEVFGLLRDQLNTEADVNVLLVNDAVLRPYLRSLLELELPYLQIFSREELGSKVQVEKAFVLSSAN